MRDDMISREAVMKSLCDEYNRRYVSGEKGGLKLAYIESAVSRVPGVGWIPVEEQLPENDDLVLVSCRTKKGQNNVNRAYYMGGSWHGSGTMSGVTAWMPLPAPYEGKA